MFERFTEESRKALVDAEKIARSRGGSAILPSDLREALPIPDPIPFAPQTKRALELSLRHALVANVDYIAPEHLFAALNEVEGK